MAKMSRSSDQKEKPYESLLRAKESFMEPDLVNAIQGLAVDLSRSCVKELRALDEPTQRDLARALKTLDFRDIRDPSAYVLRGLERGSLLGRVAAPPARPPPSPLAPPRARRRTARARARGASHS